MANYKRVDVGAEVLPLLRHMDGVDGTREALQQLQGVWDHLSMLGEFAGAGIEIAGVRSAFEGLTSRLIDQLAGAARRKVVSGLRGRAQVAIDILVRNLFERTADIGFLATDDDLRRFADASAAERDLDRPALIERLREYRRSYTVYDDVVLLDAAGTVLARLVPGGVATTDDAFVADAVRGTAAHVEAFGAFALLPGRDRALVYAQRVLSPDGRRVAGVLCLSFAFDDECRRIFDGLTGAGAGESDDWRVLALVDAAGRVIASSDALQVPPGARIDAAAEPSARLTRFAGRRWLTASCAAHAYQGYAGPGWFGVALVPVDLAFDAGDRPAVPVVTPEQVLALTASPLLFSDGLRAIPPAARAVEVDLQRAVWNGHVALCSAPDDRDSAFSKVLLREIGKTGARTRDVFTGAIAELNHTVVSALLDDTAARASLAIDILDRNLYERANDCRWWALTAAFRSALEAGPVDAGGRAALTRILQAVHGLYTVYANLVLFDRTGHVVAASREEGSAAPGRPLAAEWVPRTLALADTQAWGVSAFEPSPLYGGRPTFVYTAAVRGAADPRRVVGGIAIVFDAAPQFEAMLVDTLPRSESGTVLAGAFNLFADAGGRVIAASDGRPVAGGDARFGGAAVMPTGSPDARIVEHDGRLWAHGARASVGYREYRGGRDPSKTSVSALCVVPLATATATAASAALTPPTAPRRVSGARGRLDLASFQVAGQWYALRGTDVLEATGERRVLPLPSLGACVRGSLMHGARPVLVVDLACLLGAGRGEGEGGHIVVVRAGDGFASFGLRIESLGEHFEVDPGALEPLGSGGSLIEAVVRTGSGAVGADLLKLLSPARIAAAAFGARRVAA